MKKILVPTDFSDCAGFATDAAFKIAREQHAEIYLYTRIPGDGSAPAVTTDSVDSLPMSISGKFSDAIKQHRSGEVRVKLVYSSQDLVPGVLSYADTIDADLIIMGSSGAGGLKELVWGSNSQRMVNQSRRPVMVIKHPVEDPNFADIVFASNFYKEVKQPFERLVKFAQAFGARLHLVHVTTKDTDSVDEYLARQKMADFVMQIGGRVPHSVHFFGSIDTRHGVEHFAQDNRFDLIALVSHGEGFFKKILKGGSVTEGLVNRVEMPILTLRAAAVEKSA